MQLHCMIVRRRSPGGDGDHKLRGTLHDRRKFASLDHLSRGRASWNLVTTRYVEALKNFGCDDMVTGRHLDPHRVCA